jgi:hypothetical protein
MHQLRQREYQARGRDRDEQDGGDDPAQKRRRRQREPAPTPDGPSQQMGEADTRQAGRAPDRGGLVPGNAREDDFAGDLRVIEEPPTEQL